MGDNSATLEQLDLVRDMHQPHGHAIAVTGDLKFGHRPKVRIDSTVEESNRQYLLDSIRLGDARWVLPMIQKMQASWHQA